MATQFEPKIIAFLCNWCSYAGADLAGVSRLQYPPNIRILRFMCTGRIDPLFIFQSFIASFDGVLVLGCHPGDCHYLKGNLYAQEKIDISKRLLEIAGIGKKRLYLDWVSAAEGGRFAQIVTEFTAQIKDLGRPEANGYRHQRLEAAKNTILSEKIRQLVGKRRVLLEQGNVYGEKLSPIEFSRLLDTTLKNEFVKCWISLIVKEKPLSVKEIDAVIGAGRKTISDCVIDLWSKGKVSLYELRGENARFISKE